MLARYPSSSNAASRTTEQGATWARRGSACAAGLGAVVLVCAGVFGWSLLSGHGTSGAAHTDPASAPAGPSTPPPGDRGSAVSSLPADAVWKQVGIGGLPFSASAGPATVTGGVPAGFAHSEPGAIVAAVQILGRLSWSAQSAAAMHAVAAAGTTPTAGAEAALTYGPPSDPALIPQVAGVQVAAYSPMSAVINIALRFGGTLRIAPAKMQWSAGDWKLAGAPGPLTDTNWAAVGDLTGYLIFAGQPSVAGN